MPVRVFGEEEDCLFIQYKVSDTCMPFGYVPKDAIKVETPALDFTFKSVYTLMVDDRLPATDDPMGEAEGLEFPIELDVYVFFLNCTTGGISKITIPAGQNAFL